jgi:hypothetical protein
VLEHVGGVDGASVAGSGDRLVSGFDTAGLASGGVVQQPDGQAGVAGAVVSFGLGEYGGGLAGCIGGQG